MIIRKQDRFSLRKLSNGQLASVLLGSVVVAGTQTVEAKIVDNGDGTSTISNRLGSIKVDSNHVNENGQGFKSKKTVIGASDTIQETGKVKYKYVTKTGEVLEESDLKDSGLNRTHTISYDVVDKSGKVNTNVTVTENGTFDKESGSKDTIEKNGKTYRRTGEATVTGRGGERSNMQINDVNINATSQDLTKGTGAINYNGLSQGGRTWIIEQKLDGTYGKYVVANTPSTMDDAWVRDTYLAGENAAKDFNDANTKADGGIGENDNVIIMEKSVYVTSETHENGLTLAFGTSIVDTNKFDGRNIISELIDNEPGPDAGGTIKQMAIYRDFDNNLDHGVDKLYEITRGDINSVTGKVTKSFISKYKEFLNITGWDDTKENFIWYLASVNFNKSGDVYSNEFVPNSGFISDRTQFRLVDIMKNKDKLDKVDSDNRPTREFNMFNDSNETVDIQTNISEGEDRELHNSLPESDNYLVGLDRKDKLLVDKSIELLKKRYAQYNENTPLNFEDVTTWSGNSGLASKEENYTYNTVYTPLRAYRLNDNHMTVTYTYEEEKPKTGSVVVKYETKDGVQLKEPVTVKDNVEVPAEGVHYSTTDNAPDKLTDSQGNIYYLTPTKLKEGSAVEEGNVEAGKTLEVTYIYEPAGNVVVHYKNLDTDETLKDDLRLVDNGKAGDNYTTLTEETKLDYIDKEGKRYSIVFNQVEGSETGNVESGVTKEITYYYTEEKKARLIVNYYKEGTEEKLLDSKITENLEVGSDYITRSEIIDAVEEEIDEDARRVEKIKRYELVDRPMNDTGTIVEGDNVVNYYYREVNTENIYSKQALVVVNYYKEGTTEKLAPSVDKGRMDIGSKYTTEGVSIPSKTETEEFDDRTITKTKTYELVKEPENKEGLVPKEGAIVNYYYREVVKEDVVYKTVPKPDIKVSYTGYDVTHRFEIGEKYTQNVLFGHPEFGGITESARGVYHLIADATNIANFENEKRKYELEIAKMFGFTSVEALNKNDPSGESLDFDNDQVFEKWWEFVSISKRVDKGDISLNNPSFSYYVNDTEKRYEGTSEKYYDYESTIPEGTEIELSRLTYRIGDGPEIEVPEDKVDSMDFSRKNGTMQENKTTHFTYYYRLKKREEVKSTEEVKGSVVVKYIDDKGNKLAGDVQVVNPTTVANKVTKDIISGTVTLDTKVDTENVDVKYDTTNLRRDTIVKDGVTYRLEEVLPAGNVYNNTTEEIGNVKPGVTTVVYKYTPVKKGGLTVNYYKENSVVKLAESEGRNGLDVGSEYTTEAKVIEPKTVVDELPDRTVTRNISYELVNTPENAQGKISESETIVNYYYREVVKEDVSMKKDGLTVNFYKEGTKDKLADSIVEIDKVIGSDYTTMSAVIPFKVVTEELPDRTVTRTISYELVKTPENANGKIVQGGTIVNYYYREIVKEDVNMKKDGLTVNFYKEGTKDKLADSVVEGDKVIGSDYTTTPKEIQGRVENEDLPDRTVKRVISYVLTGTPENANGKIVSGGTVVDYYYREVVKEDITMKKDGVVANYYKVGTKEKLAESEVISDKAIGSDYTTIFKTIEPKVTVVDLPDKVVRRTVRYELVERPFNENGKVVRGGTVVDYYYKEIVDEEVTPKKKNSSYANGFSVVKKKLAAYATSFTIRTLKR